MSTDLDRCAGWLEWLEWLGDRPIRRCPWRQGCGLRWPRDYLPATERSARCFAWLDELLLDVGRG